MKIAKLSQYLIRISLTIIQIQCQNLLAADVPLNNFTYSNPPRWSQKQLNGQRSYNDGPNCYNSAIITKGYSDFLMYSDPVEMAYFLTRFCQLNTYAPQEGDVMIAQKHLMKHAAIYLRDGFLFEKRNNEGASLSRSRFSDTTYRIEELSASAQFGYCQEPICKIQYYTCQNHSDVREKNLRCNEFVHQLGSTPIQNILQKIGLDPNKNLQTEANLDSYLKDFAYNISLLEGQSECHVYAMAVGTSILGNIQLLNASQNQEWEVLINQFKDTLNNLRLKINSSSILTQKFQVLMEESLWLSRSVR